MSLFQIWLSWLSCRASWLINFFYRPADYVIQRDGSPYLLRWHVIPRNRYFNIYLHKLVRPDWDEALHDHPWVNLSIILAGAYREIEPRGARVLRAGSARLRCAAQAHRLELLSNVPCWSLFITGPKVREWGFLCRHGWVHYSDFVVPGRHGEIGAGCAGPVSAPGTRRKRKPGEIDDSKQIRL